jgi:hypothetical protein
MLAPRMGMRTKSISNEFIQQVQKPFSSLSLNLDLFHMHSVLMSLLVRELVPLPNPVDSFPLLHLIFVGNVHESGDDRGHDHIQIPNLNRTSLHRMIRQTSLVCGICNIL